jgi:hypothetical protein
LPQFFHQGLNILPVFQLQKPRWWVLGQTIDSPTPRNIIEAVASNSAKEVKDYVMVSVMVDGAKSADRYWNIGSSYWHIDASFP